MLNGIEVLNQTEILACPKWVGIAASICAIAIVVGFIGIIICGICDTDWMHIVFCGMFLISLLLFAIFSKIEREELTIPTGKYEYQVTIDDSVSMNEFYEKYEIVEVNGKIYAIREKE